MIKKNWKVVYRVNIGTEGNLQHVGELKIKETKKKKKRNKEKKEEEVWYSA